MGFDLLKANLFRGSVFKQAKFLVSSPTKSQKVIYIAESGDISIEYLPISTGFINSTPEIHKTWAIVNQLKFRMQKNDEPYDDETVLIITDRSYKPLDPNKVLKERELEKRASLKQIAKTSHAIKRSQVGRRQFHKDIAELFMVWSFALIILAGIAKFFMAMKGG